MDCSVRLGAGCGVFQVLWSVFSGDRRVSGNGNDGGPLRIHVADASRPPVLTTDVTFGSPARGRSFVSGRWRRRSRCLRRGIVKPSGVRPVPVPPRRYRGVSKVAGERMPWTSLWSSTYGPGPRGTGESGDERRERLSNPGYEFSRAAGHGRPSGLAGSVASLEPDSVGTDVYLAPGHVRDRGNGRPAGIPGG